MDNAFTERIQAYLALDPAKQDIKVGADMLLAMNGDKFLHGRILAHPDLMRRTLIAKLNKYLLVRLDGLTRSEVVVMEQRVTAAARADVDAHQKRTVADAPAHAGRRPDHDSLPADIRSLYERNGDIFRRLRATFETLKKMEHEAACDRYEFLKILDGLDKEYRANWEAYDGYTAPHEK